MRKKALPLVLALAAAAAALLVPPRLAASGSCLICTTYSNGSKCCVDCICSATGRIIACTENFCPPAE
jgi:hypothetical protein